MGAAEEEKKSGREETDSPQDGRGINESLDAGTTSAAVTGSGRDVDSGSRGEVLVGRRVVGGRGVGDGHDGVEPIGINGGRNKTDCEAVPAGDGGNFFLIVPVAHGIEAQKAADGGFEEMLPAMGVGAVVEAGVVEAAAAFVEDAAADELGVRVHHAASIGDVAGKHLRIEVLDHAVGKN